MQVFVLEVWDEDVEAVVLKDVYATEASAKRAVPDVQVDQWVWIDGYGTEPGYWTDTQNHVGIPDGRWFVRPCELNP